MQIGCGGDDDKIILVMDIGLLFIFYTIVFVSYVAVILVFTSLLACWLMIRRFTLATIHYRRVG